MEGNFVKIQKLFTDWATLKPSIHFDKKTNEVFFRERQIWWASLGQNIGSEQNGKNKNFERPILVLKQFNLEMFLAIPLSSKVKPGNHRYVFKRGGVWYIANLSQMRVLSGKRLLRYIANMKQKDFLEIQKLYKNIL